MGNQPPDFSPRLDEKLCSTLLHSIRGIIWECDASTFRFSYVSPQAERILGYPSRQWIEEPDFWRSHTHPDDVLWCTVYCREATERNEDHEFEYRMIAADGTIVWLRDIVTVVRTEDGSTSLRGIMIDITGSKRAEQTLREQEELYRAMVNQAPDGVVLIDTETLGFKEFNDPACAGLGYGREEFAKLTVRDIDGEFTGDRLNELIQGIISQGHAAFETVHRHRDRTVRNVRISVRTVQIRGHHYLLSFWTDITEQIQLLETLRLREHYQRALLDNFPHAAWMKDGEGRFLAANRQLAAASGLQSPKQLVGKTIFDVAPLELATRNTEEDRRVLLNGRTKHAEESLPVRGENRWFEIYQSPITIDGQAMGTVGCTWDITERRAFENALKESEERYRRLVELSPDAVFIHTNGKFVYLNPTAYRLLGARSAEELYGRVALDFIHPDQREMVRQRIESALSRRDNPPIEELMVRLDGSTVPVEMVSVPYTYQGFDSVLAIARDISERKKVQDELIKAQKLESLGVLAGGIAHDFNNILTGILGNISLVRNGLAPSNVINRRLESCEQAAIRATELTQQLLTFARGGEPVRRLMDTGQLIRECSSFVLRGSKVKSSIEIADDLCWIEADSGQICQALNNILINAIQAMPNGGIVRLSAKNEVMGPSNALNLPPGQYLEIVVEDRGCGIPPENLTKIFDPYFTTKQSGSGLGLASVYSIIRRHGGAVRVSSSQGVGSTFTMYLPAVSEQVTGNRIVVAKEALAGSGRILIMDDEKIIRDVATQILEMVGYHVESCADGGEALERVRDANGKNTPFDAVIMDLTIPGGLGGMEAAGLMLEIAPDAVLIVSSGYSNDPVMANFRHYGFSGSVVKPFSFDSLTREVQRLIGK
ncbi:MAG: PAS domain S-box protein [Desulfuromonadales bacterium]|nr:PAS domain S-box protein [Desulfuromonadales bacterium]